MSNQTIFQALRDGGLSPAGACAVMGNIFCESGMKSNIVEKRCSMSDAEYTDSVDKGFISPTQFSKDGYGYGLCQWTYYTRKAALLNFAKASGTSVGDEKMQCEFLINELSTDFASLYIYLCRATDLAEATKKVCTDFERPAVNNFADRINAAQKFFNEFGGTPTAAYQSVAQTKDTGVIASILDVIIPDWLKPKKTNDCKQDTWVALAKKMPALSKGDGNAAVIALQGMLNQLGANLKVDGDFGELTQDALMAFKEGRL